ncbi:hypothetical protein KP806_10775 [Paenibacillus sp. N4]|uniref:hypothetical protein n=1 Tax=Paenibacillus vietnamensis TaxID=2590547 RepID=UPI001CD11413|nr:hypothetical protein [Paenibacillus vietnamensis]MCA0755537.1 hypothetical protein [Paenibacillus vietnamensis]
MLYPERRRGGDARASIAIAVGIGLGMLFSKLFFMALAVLLNMDETIRFTVPLKAVWMTAAGFFALFLAISGWTALRIGRAVVPVVVAIYHALFAMAALDNMMESSNWIYSSVIIGIFIVMQTLYFFIAWGSYMKSMLRGAAV